MKLIVGLGNPGEKYQKSRHNTGFIVLNRLAEERGLEWENSARFGSEIAEYNDVILVKPQTFMNNSGDAVSKIMSFYKIFPELRINPRSADYYSIGIELQGLLLSLQFRCTVYVLRVRG